MPRQVIVHVCELCGYVSNQGELDVKRCELVHNELKDIRIVSILSDPDGNLVPGSRNTRMRYREGEPMPSVINVAGKGGKVEVYVRLQAIEDSTENYAPFDLGVESGGQLDIPPKE